MNFFRSSGNKMMLFALLMICASVANSATPMLLNPTLPSSSEVIAIEDPESKAAVRELVSQLNDDAVRALLIERLDAVAEAKELERGANDGALSLLEQSLVGYWNKTVQSVKGIAGIPGSLNQVGASVRKASAPDTFSSLFLILLLAVAVGLAAERAVAFLFRKHKQRLIDSVSYTLVGILKIIYTRLTYDICGVVAFSAASYLVIANHYPGESLPNQVIHIVTSMLAAAGFAYVLARFYFAPARPEIRVCHTSDERAWRLTISYTLLAAYVDFGHNVFALFVSIGFADYGGMDYIWSLAYFLHISIYMAAAYTIWHNREGLTEVLLENKKRITLAIGDEASEQLSWFAVRWPVIAIALLIGQYLMVEIVVNAAGVGTYSQFAVYMTFLVIFLWPGIDANISLWVWKGVYTPEDETAAAAKARRNMQQGLLRVGRVMVVGAVLYIYARLWGLNILDLAESNLGAQAAGGLIELMFIFLMAYLMWELATILIERWLALEGGAAEDQEEAGGGEIGGVGLSRVATVLPIIHKTAKVLIVVVSIVMILDKWGVNIGPIIAGAGVLGLAIGFGAQTLVKDIVSGLFFLADDAFRLGEYIDVDGTMGSVEKISLRSLRLRHHRGLVHTIPYGEIPKLTNFSRDWVIMKLRFRVPFDTDINKIKKIFKAIGSDLLAHPELGEDFLQPFKSQGVAEVDDNGIVVRGKFTAKPGKQFMIRKEVYVRVQKAFEEAGIPFARKQVMVHIPGLEASQKLSTDQVKAIGAAASEAVEDEVLPADGKPVN